MIYTISENFDLPEGHEDRIELASIYSTRQDCLIHSVICGKTYTVISATTKFTENEAKQIVLDFLKTV